MTMTTRCYPREVVRRVFAARLPLADEGAYARRLRDGTGPEHKDSDLRGDVFAHIATSASGTKLHVSIKTILGCITTLGEVCDKALGCASPLPTPRVWLRSAWDR